MKKIIWLLIMIVAIIILFGILWQTKIIRAPSPVALTPVTARLKWLHQAQFAGMYAAREKGFYKDQGLDVTLEPFNFENPTIDAVANKKADFGVTGADELVLARAKGLPLKAIAVIYKINPVCAYSLKERNITRPQDFVGKIVGLEKGTNVDLLYYVMMQKLGIDRKKIREIQIGYDATELLNGTTDVSTGYVINEPQQAMEMGKQVNIILMADYGANMYADVIFTRDDLIQANPLLVEKFLRATINGWQYAVENNEEVVDFVLKYAPNGNKTHESYMLKNSIPLINTGDSPIGFMDKSKWESLQNILFEQNILNKKIDISQVYTTTFLDKISSGQ